MLRLLWPVTTCLQPCGRVAAEDAVQLAALPRGQLVGRLLAAAGGDEHKLARWEVAAVNGGAGLCAGLQR